MDVHPTKNVSIGIDPYPNHQLKLIFPQTKCGGQDRPQVLSMSTLIAKEQRKALSHFEPGVELLSVSLLGFVIMVAVDIRYVFI